MYSLNCNYYDKSFNTVSELIDDVIISGMDPNYEITHNGTTTGEKAVELIVFQAMLEKIKSKLLTKLFMEWVNDEFDIETLEASKIMIQQRQDTVNTLLDKANPPKPIGFVIGKK